MIPLAQFQMYLGSRRPLSITVKPRDLSLITQAQDAATVALRGARRLKPKQPDNFGVFTSDTFSTSTTRRRTASSRSWSGSSLSSLVVGGIVIMNIMLMV